MDKQTRAYSFYRLLFSNKKEHSTDTYYNMGESLNYFAELKDPGEEKSAWCTVARMCRYMHIYVKLQKVQMNLSWQGADQWLPGRARRRGQGKEIATLGTDVITLLVVVMVSQVSKCTKSYTLNMCLLYFSHTWIKLWWKVLPTWLNPFCALCEDFHDPSTPSSLHQVGSVAPSAAVWWQLNLAILILEINNVCLSPHSLPSFWKAESGFLAPH